MAGDLSLFNYGVVNDGTSGGDTSVVFPFTTEVEGVGWYSKDLVYVVVCGIDPAVSFSMDVGWAQEYDYVSDANGRITVFSHTAQAPESDYTVTADSPTEFMFFFLVFHVDPAAELLISSVDFNYSEVMDASSINLWDQIYPYPGWSRPIQTSFVAVYLDAVGGTSNVENPAPFAEFIQETTVNTRAWLKKFDTAYDSPSVVMWQDIGDAPLTGAGNVMAIAWGLARKSEVDYDIAHPLPCYNSNQLQQLPGGAEAYAFAINASGRVAGQANDGTGLRAVTWTGTALPVQLDLLSGGTQAVPYGISDGGTVVGGGDATDTYQHAIKWAPPPSASDLGNLGFASGATADAAYAIGALGHPVGQSASDSGHVSVPTIWRPAASDLGALTPSATDPGDRAAQALGVNSFDDAAGWSRTGDDPGVPRAVWWPSSGGVVSLGFPGSQAQAINDSQDIVGWDLTGAILWSGPNPTSGDGSYLPYLLGGTVAYAYGINNSGVICGAAIDWLGDFQAVVWRGGEAVPLPGLVEPGGDSWAYAINESGQVAGYSRDGAGVYWAVVWTPCDSGADTSGPYGFWGIDTREIRTVSDMTCLDLKFESIEFTEFTASGGAQTVPVNVPAGANSGDLLVLFAENHTGPVPSGWAGGAASGGSYGNPGAFWKVADGSEGSSVDYSLAASSWTGVLCFAIARYSSTVSLAGLVTAPYFAPPASGTWVWWQGVYMSLTYYEYTGIQYPNSSFFTTSGQMNFITCEYAYKAGGLDYRTQDMTQRAAYYYASGNKLLIVEDKLAIWSADGVGTSGTQVPPGSLLGGAYNGVVCDIPGVV